MLNCTATGSGGSTLPTPTETLVDLLADVKPTIPRYCRVNRVIRDIPSTNVVAGNKRTSLRMDVHKALQARGQRCQCVRCREVRRKTVAQIQSSWKSWSIRLKKPKSIFSPM